MGISGDFGDIICFFPEDLQTLYCKVLHFLIPREFQRFLNLLSGNMMTSPILEISSSFHSDNYKCVDKLLLNIHKIDIISLGKILLCLSLRFFSDSL